MSNLNILAVSISFLIPVGKLCWFRICYLCGVNKASALPVPVNVMSEIHCMLLTNCDPLIGPEPLAFPVEVDPGLRVAGHQDWEDHLATNRETWVNLGIPLSRIFTIMLGVGRFCFDVIHVCCFSQYSGRRLEWQRLQWQSATVTVFGIPDSLVLKDKRLLWQKIGYSDTQIPS